MEEKNLNELLSLYKKTVSEKNKTLVSIAFDELESSQYDEATTHFDQLYTQDSSDYMSYFFRAYCKSHTGKRGNVYPDSQKLTSAFKSSVKKVIETKKDLSTNLSIIIRLYVDGMDNLADNAVAETPDKGNILKDELDAISDIASTYTEIIKNDDEICKYVISKLRIYEMVDIKTYGDVIVSLDPSYQDVLDEKLKKAKRAKTIQSIVGLSVLGVIIIIILISQISSCF